MIKQKENRFFLFCLILYYFYKYIGGRQKNLGHDDKALKSYIKAIGCGTIAFKDKPECYAEIYVEIAEINRKNGDWEDSMLHLNKAREIYEKKEIKDERLSKTIREIGSVSWDMDRLEEAEQCYNMAKEIDEKFNNKEGLAKDLNNLGILKKEQFEYTESLDLFKKANELYLQCDGVEKKVMAVLYLNTSSVLVEMKNFSKALDYAITALTICSEHYPKDKRTVAICYDAIGSCLFGKGCYEKALNSHENAFALLKELYQDEKHYLLASNYYFRGRATANINYRKKAIGYYEKAIDIYYSLGNNNKDFILKRNIETIERSLKLLKGNENARN